MLTKKESETAEHTGVGPFCRYSPMQLSSMVQTPSII